MSMTMTIRDEKELKKWQNEKKTLCNARKAFTNVEVKENIAEVVMEIERVIGEDTNYSSKETTIVVKHKNVKMMDYKVNTRFPTVTKPVREMWKQMIECPAAFKEKNLGITVYCKSATIYEENGKRYIKIIFGEHGGVENGGHTLAAILEGKLMEILSDEGEVKIFVREYTVDISSSEVASTCSALNSMQKQTIYGFGEIAGYHEDFKKALGTYADKVEWKPNKEKKNKDDMFVFDVVDVVCMAEVMAPNAKGEFKNRYNTGHSKNDAYESFLISKEKGEVHNCEKMYPFMIEVVEVADHIMRTFHKVPKKYVNNFDFKDSNKLSPISGKPMEKVLSRLLLQPILGALSENIKFNPKTGEISTYMDFCELYDLSANKLWEALNGLQKSHGAVGKYVFCNSVAESTWKLMRSEVRNVLLSAKNCAA